LTRSAAEVTEYIMEEGNDANNEENLDDSMNRDDQKLIVENEEGKKMKKTILDHLGILLFSIGISIIVLTIIVWTTAIDSNHSEAPAFWLILGIFFASHGTIRYFKPNDDFNLDLSANGKHFSGSIPLQSIAIRSTNIVCALTGIITMSTLGPYWYWTAWNILGLVLSILLLIYAVIPRRLIQEPIKCLKRHSEVLLGWSISSKTTDVFEDCGVLLQSQINVIVNLLSVPSAKFFVSLSEEIYKPKKLTNKPVHIVCLLTAIILSILMFSTQLWNMMEVNCGEDGYWINCDPKDSFAMYNVYFDIASFKERKLIILIGAPILFILCSMLLFLLKGTTPLRMLLSSLISLVIGIMLFVFSLFSIQCIIFMSAKMTIMFKILTLVSLSPVPLLSAIFMALSYNNLVQMTKEKGTEPWNKKKASLLGISGTLLIIFAGLSMTSTVNSSITVMEKTQANWNTTNNYNYDYECNDNYINYRDYSEYGERSSSPKSKPEKCFLKSLDYHIMEEVVFFSVSQMCVTESVLFFTLFFFLIGKRITRKTLFLPGLFLFAAGISNIITYCLGHTLQQDNSLFFLILTGIPTISAIGIGAGLIIAGISFATSFLILLLRLILASVLVVILVLTSTIQLLLLLVSKILRSNIIDKKDPTHLVTA